MSQVSLAVPQEVVDEIFDYIPDTPDGLKTLKFASLICRSFRFSSRVRLFRRIDLYDDDSEPTKLDILLQRAPHLLHHVQVLRIIGVGDVYQHLGLFETSTTLPTSLKAFRNEGSHHVTLQRIELQYLDWGKMSSGMQAVLLDLLACSSLCQVRLHSIGWRPPANLIERLPPAVKHLDISDTKIPLPVSKLFRQLLQLETLTLQFSEAKSTAGEVLRTPVGCVTRLRSLELSTCDTTLWPVYRAIIQHASSSLQELYIRIYITAEDFNSVDFSRFPRIRKIVIITPRLRDWPMCVASFRAAIIWLSQSLSNMSCNNNIDQVIIRFREETRQYVSDAQFDAMIEKAAWESLDETLSQPNLAWSKTFIGINLQICTDKQDTYDCLNGLVHANLPRMERLNKLHVTREGFNDIRYDIERLEFP